MLLEGPDETDPVIGMEARGRGRIERGEPGVKRAIPLFRGQGFERASEGRIGGGCRVEALEESADIQAGAAHDHGKLPARLDARDGLEGLAPEAGGMVALVGADQIQKVMAHGRPLGGRGLARADVHVPVDLTGIRAHDLHGQALAQAHRHRRLADARRPHDHEERRGLYHVRRSSRLISLSESRETMGRPCGQKYGVSVPDRSAMRRVISSRWSGAWALIAAWQATKLSAR